jgi:SRSO17 transposase
MDFRRADDSESRFAAYVEGLVSVIGHADRAKPLRDYCVGLMLPCERKSVEPMAAVTAPARVAAQHQSLLHFVGEGHWSDEKVLAKVREMVLPEMERHGPIEAWIIDDTGFPKQGRHSVGVARQYCGQIGKQDNCQVAVSLSIANHHASLPVAYRLYLPQDWAKDRQRRRKAGVPEDISFKTKPEIAIEQLRWACAAGLPRGVVLMDAGYGCNTDLRAGVSALELSYVAGILPQTSVWGSGTGPLPPKKWSGRGRPPKLIRRDGKHRPISVKKLALGLPKRAWRTVKWREGAAEHLSSRFARVRVRVAHRDYNLTDSRPEEWLLIEWPKGENEPTKYWLSTLPKNIPFRRLVDIAKLRWRIERDYQDLKQEVGLGHFEGRGWRGFHHHATLCIAAYGFLVSERETIPPCGPRSSRLFKKLAVPDGYRPRGSALAA